MTEVSSALQSWLIQVFSASRVNITSLVRGPDEASVSTWLISAEVDNRLLNLLFRLDRSNEYRSTRSVMHEAAIIREASRAGVATPECLAICDDRDLMPYPAALYRAIPGARSFIAAGMTQQEGADLAEQLGRQLARVHQIGNRAVDLEFLTKPAGNAVIDCVEQLRERLDRLSQPRPALEWGLRWAECNAGVGAPLVIGHNMFHCGSVLIDEVRRPNIINWMAAGWADPMADIGTFCAACWRYGRVDLEAGGIAPREVFYRGYEQESGRSIDDRRVTVWEVLAHVDMAATMLVPSQRGSGSAVEQLQNALAFRAVSKLELNVVRMTGPERWSRN